MAQLTGGFVHVDVVAQGGVHPLSEALSTTFLPARAKNMAAVLSADVRLCRFRKPGIDPRILERLERDLSPVPPKTSKELLDREARIKARVDAERAKTGQPKLPELEQTEGPGITLDEVRNEPDAAKRPAARARAIQKIVRDEPPRKTVTGHFRAH